jgi:hypothetical protein
MAALRAALAESRGTIHALEAELQDTMEAAMQLWDTVQVCAPVDMTLGCLRFC